MQTAKTGKAKTGCVFFLQQKAILTKLCTQLFYMDYSLWIGDCSLNFP